MINNFLTDHNLPIIKDPAKGNTGKDLNKKDTNKDKGKKSKDKDQENRKAKESSNDRYKVTEQETHSAREYSFPSSVSLNQRSMQFQSQSQFPLSQRSISESDIVYSLWGTGPGIPPSLPPLLPEYFQIDQLKRRIEAKEKAKTSQKLTKEKRDEHVTRSKKEMESKEQTNNEESDSDSLFGGQQEASTSNQSQYQDLKKQYANTIWSHSQEDSQDIPSTFYDTQNSKGGNQNSHMSSLASLIDELNSSGEESNITDDLSEKNSPMEITAKTNTAVTEGEVNKKDQNRNATNKKEEMSEEVIEDEEVKLVLTGVTPTITENEKDNDQELAKELAKKVAKKMLERMKNKEREEQPKEEASGQSVKPKRRTRNNNRDN